MTREEFMDIVYSELHSDGDNCRANRIIDAADEYAEEQTRWIPVSEKLPNLNDYDGSKVWQRKVLITGYLSFDSKKCLFVTEAFASDVVNNCVWDTVVVAWMPLPEPYQPEIPTVAEGSEE